MHSGVFWWSTRCFIWWWNTVSNAWYYFSNKMILEGEIKDAKMSSFSSDSQHSVNINFLCIFFINDLSKHFFYNYVNKPGFSFYSTPVSHHIKWTIWSSSCDAHDPFRRKKASISGLPGKALRKQMHYFVNFLFLATQGHVMKFSAIWPHPIKYFLQHHICSKIFFSAVPPHPFKHFL